MGLILLSALLVAEPLWAGQRPVPKKAAEFDVEIQFEKDPPRVGANRIEIAVTDEYGVALKDAKVILGAFLPAQPGRPLVRSTAVAKWEKNRYRALIDLPVGGTWEMSLAVTRGGKTTTARWTVDAW
jgi:hypothetical protein